MSSPEDQSPNTDPNEDGPSNGPNLVLIYSLVALALISAIAIAIMIVLPFYNRR